MKISKRTIFNAPVITPLLREVSLFILRLIKWEVKGKLPQISKYVMTAAPHTSNWDFILVLLISFALKIKIHIMAKKEIMDWPLGFLFKYLGIIPIDRSQSANTVDQAVALMKEAEELVILISPAGTRKKTDRWKTGFYHIANLSKTPILYGFLDYEKKSGGIGPVFYTSGDVEADMKQIMVFYAGVVGKYPQAQYAA